MSYEEGLKQIEELAASLAAEQQAAEVQIHWRQPDPSDLEGTHFLVVAMDGQKVEVPIAREMIEDYPVERLVQSGVRNLVGQRISRAARR